MTCFCNVPIFPQVTENKGHWDIKTSTTLKTMELKFELDKEFDETTPDGRLTILLDHSVGFKFSIILNSSILANVTSLIFTSYAL